MGEAREWYVLLSRLPSQTFRHGLSVSTQVLSTLQRRLQDVLRRGNGIQAQQAGNASRGAIHQVEPFIFSDLTGKQEDQFLDLLQQCRTMPEHVQVREEIHQRTHA